MIGRIAAIGAKILLVLALVVFFLVPLYAFVHPVSTVMFGRWITGKPVTRIWKPLDEFSPNLVRVVIAAEYARYCAHWGVDWVEVNHSIGDADDLDGIRGASTIPMQTAKNLFLWPGRQFIRKALDIPLAIFMSAIW